MYWYKQDATIDFKELYKKRNSPTARLKRTLVVYSFLFFMLVAGFTLVANANYVDPTNKCYIKIKYDVMRGNKKTIVEAIEKVKNEDYLTYMNLCKYVKTIYEEDCVYADDDSAEFYKAKTQGCFIKGAKAIMISPYPNYTVDGVKHRAELLIYLSKLSTAYWASM